MKKRELLAMIQVLEARVVALESTTSNRLRYITTGDPWHPMPPVTCGDVGPQATASTSDTAIIPPETIAKANTDSAFIGGLTHEKGTGYPILDDESKRIAEAVANTPHSC